jgi:hypothetical protein
MPYAPWKAQLPEWERGKRVISAIFKKKDFRGGKRGAIKKGQSTGIPSSGQYPRPSSVSGGLFDPC